MIQPSTRTAPVKNRRRSRRCPIRGDVRLECREGSLGLGRNLTVAAVDLSETGARLVVQIPLAPGGEVEVFVIGAGLVRPLMRGGKVRWSQDLVNGGYLVGVYFENALPYADWQRLIRRLE